MLIYEKTVDGKRHLYYSESGIPGPEDIALTYKDGEGNIITPVDGDTYRDHSSEGVHRIKRDSDGKVVNVFAGEKQIIGDEIPEPEPELVKIEITKNPTKVEYLEGDLLDLEGLEVTAIYSDESTVDVTDKVTTSPEAGTELTPEDVNVGVSYSEESGSAMAAFSITVTPKNEEEPEKEEEKEPVEEPVEA